MRLAVAVGIPVTIAVLCGLAYLANLVYRLVRPAARFVNTTQYPVAGWAAFDGGSDSHTTTADDRAVASVAEAKRRCAADAACVGFYFPTGGSYARLTKGPAWSPLTAGQAAQIAPPPGQTGDVWLKLAG